MECPVALRQSFLLQAQEAFTIGLLTKAEGESVTSKQELHTFLKAAYSLTVTCKWLGAPPEPVAEATEACLKALAKFYDYDSDAQNKESLCMEIMHLVFQVKKLLGVEPFKNSELGSFIPDSYRNMDDTSVSFTLEGFAQVMQRFKQYHASICKETSKYKRSSDELDGPRVCITALGTTVDALNTACKTEAGNIDEPKKQDCNSSMAHPHEKFELCTTTGSTDELGSSWQNFSSISGSPVNETKPIDGSDSGLQSSKNMGAFSTSNRSSERFEVTQAGIDTLYTEEDEVTQQNPPRTGETLESLSQLALKTSSSSLSGSFRSQSSWEKIDSPLNPSAAAKPVYMGVDRKSADSDGSFQFLETLDSEVPDSAYDHMLSNRTSQGDFRGLTRPQPPESHYNDSAPVKLAPNVGPPQLSRPQPIPGQLASTETSTESSFEMLRESPAEGGDEVSRSRDDTPGRKNPSCYCCVNSSTTAGVAPEKQYSLSLQDYEALLAGICHECMLKRFYSEKIQFKLKKHRTAYSKCEFDSMSISWVWLIYSSSIVQKI